MASPLLPVAFAAFAGLAVEGLVVETDHWRIYFVVLGLLWGLTFPGRPEAHAKFATAIARQRRPTLLPLPVEIAILPVRPPRRAARLIAPVVMKAQPIEVFRPKTRRREPRRKARLILH